MNIELRQLGILLEVAENKSFSIASDKLFLSQSTISSHIKKLEASVGAKLLDRSKSQMTPTQEGEIVLKYADYIISLVEEMEDYLSQCRNGSRGLLTIEFASTVYSFILPDIIHCFTKQFPNIQLRSNTSMTPEIIENILSGKIQAGVIKMPTKHCNINGLNSILIEKDHTEIACAVDYPLLSKLIITFDDIANHPILFYAYNTNYSNQIRSVFEKKGLKFDVAMKYDNLDAVLTMVELGNGISFLPSKVLRDKLLQNKVAVIPVQDMPLIERYTFLIYKKRMDAHPSPLSNFINYIEDYGKSLDKKP